MKIKHKELHGTGYEELWDPSLVHIHYWILQGSKNSKKSQTVADEIIEHLMANPLHNAVVVRKFQNTHRESTLPTLIFAIEKLFQKLGRNYEDYFKITKSSPVAITFLPYGNEIRFFSLDPKESGKFSGLRPNNIGFFTRLWIEEPVERGEGAQSPDEVEFTLQTFRQLHNSVFRGKHNLPTRTYLTFNPWSGKNWVEEEFVSNDMIEDRETLETKGKQVAIFPNAHKGMGKIVIVTNYKINEFITPTNIAYFEDLKERDPVTYTTEGLGIRGQFVGGIYGDLLHNIEWITEEQVKNEAVHWMGGVDYSDSKDATVACLTAISVDERPIIYYGGGWYHSKRYSLQRYDDKQKAEQIINFYKGMGEKYELEKQYKNESMPIYVDYAVAPFITILNDLSSEIEWFHFEKSSKPKIALRIVATRQLLSQQRVKMVDTPEARQLVKELASAKYKNEEREDGFDDSINAWEYSWADLSIW